MPRRPGPPQGLRSLSSRWPQGQLEYLAARASAEGIGVGELLRRVVAEEQVRRPLEVPRG